MVNADQASTTQHRPEKAAQLARREGVGAARGLLTGAIITIGLWLGLMGLFLLVFR